MNIRWVASGLVIATATVFAIPQQSGRLGFSKEGLRRQQEAEASFQAGVSVAAISQIHRDVTSRPHVAGSPGSMAVVEKLTQALKDAGLQTEIHEFNVHLSTPRSISVQLTEPVQESLDVTEPPSPDDAASSHGELGPAFVAYSASGTVTAPVVYVNYGLPGDYEQLESAGVDVKGKIAIARYARSHRAVKVHTAEQRGAAALVLYSDPADDGFARGLTWPEGPWRADFQAQSGNAKYSWFWHGDPLTPGVGARAGAPAIDPAVAPTLPKIPVVVLSSRHAERILSHLQGAAVPAGFQGGLPFTYRLGPGPAVVKLDVQMENGRRPIRNVVARITGRDPDRWVVMGTHHDAWTFGGMDPGTGLAAVYETARGLAALQKRGWTPERSILFAFWDAEEFGLIGSTEYAEAFAEELRAKAVCYVNTDLFMRGRFDGGGTPSLRDFVVEVTKDVEHWSGTGTVYDEWRATEWRRQPPERRRRGQAGFEVELGALGSGADFVAFQDYLGLPTLQMEFDFEGSYGTYHSRYDTRQFVERFADPGFSVARTVTRLLGLTAMRLANAEILPFRYSHYGKTIGGFLDVADGWARDGDGRQAIALDLSRAKRLADEIARKAAALEQRLQRRLSGGSLTAPALRDVNDRLARMEQELLDDSGSPSERWYRHVIYGWNIYSLYEGQPLPGLAEAIRVADPGRVATETQRVERVLQRMSAALDKVGGN